MADELDQLNLDLGAPTPSESPSAPASKKTASRAKGMQFWLVALLAGGSIAIGFGAQFLLQPAEPPTASQEEPPTSAAPPPPIGFTAREDFNEAEIQQLLTKRLRDGESPEAIRLMKRLPAHSQEKLPSAVLFQLSRAHADVGDFSTALSICTKVYNAEPLNTPLRIQADLELARLHTAGGDAALAQRRLITLLSTKSAAQLTVKQRAAAEHLLGLACYLLALPHTDALTELDHLLPPQVKLIPPGDFTSPGTVARGAALTGDPQLIQSRLGNDPENIIVGGKLPEANLGKLIETLCAESRLGLRYSPSATTIIRARHASWHGDATNLGVVLDRLLTAAGIAWAFSSKTNTIHIRLENELDNERQTIARRRVAERALQEAVTRYPDESHVPSSFMALANLSSLKGDFEVASNQYVQIVRRFPTTDVRGAVHFNHAKTLTKLGDITGAETQFQLAADHSANQTVEAVCWLYTGHLALEDHRVQAAVRPLLRIFSLTPSPEIRAEAACTLAAAWLLDGNHFAANDALMQHREDFGKVSERQRDLAAFLSAYARFHAADEAELAAATQELYAATSHVADDKSLWTHRVYLLGQVWKQLGLPNRMARDYALCVRRQHNGGLRTVTLRALVDHTRGIGDRNAAGRWLAELAATQPKETWNARLQLAELSFENRQDSDCLRQCVHLVEQTPKDADNSAVLRLMGRVYQRQGKHADAALCFAGMLPSDVAASPPEAQP